MKVIHFYNGKGGGIQTVISHLINYRIDNKITYEIIYLIEKEFVINFQRIPLNSFISEKYFIYNKNWNFYYTLKQLKQLIPDSDSILVTHDWLELALITQLGLSNPTLSFLHGNYDYYLKLFLLHKKSVNLFLSVTKDLIVSIDQSCQKFNGKIEYYSCPVPDFSYHEKKYDKLKILFIASNLKDQNKNFKLLPQIDKNLISKNTYVEWHIVGNGFSKKEVITLFDDVSSRVNYYGYVKNDELSQIYKKVNVLINCSFKEGLPITVVEAMKHGVIPIAYDWGGSAKEIIKDKSIGIIVEQNSSEYFSNAILELLDSQFKLPKIALNAHKIATLKHSFVNQIQKFEYFLISICDLKSNRTPIKVYGSRLDHPKIPNFVTKIYRRTVRVIYG